MTVTLSVDPERTVTIPIEATGRNGATSADYSVPASLTFTAGQTSMPITFAATADNENDDGESVRLSFGATLPAGVTAGTPAQATVTITDDDAPTSLTVSFGQSAYTVAESDDTGTANVMENTVEVTVTLSVDPERTVTIPIETTDLNGATAADYSGVPQNVTFNAGDTSMPFTFAATQDTVDDDGESVRLSFGASLPPGVTAGTGPAQATVTITDDGRPYLPHGEFWPERLYGGRERRHGDRQRDGEHRGGDGHPERRPRAYGNHPHRDHRPERGDCGRLLRACPRTSPSTAATPPCPSPSPPQADNEDDDGESVRLSFGAMPDARVSEGSPDEATVNIRQFSTEFTLDCMASVWCADLQFSDQSKLDWGWAQLEHGNRRDPESTLSDDSFSFRGVEYEVRGLHLNAGTYPTLANAWSREEQGRSKLGIIVTPVGQSSAPSREHYRDWVLHMDGLELPFKDVVHSRYGIFLWIDADLQQLFSVWTPTTVNKVGIQEVAAVDQLPSLAVPWLPMAVEAHGRGANELRVSWLPPLWHHRIPAPTGYIVQWKLASASWSTPAAVAQREVAGRHGRQIAIKGLTENTLYSVRVFPFNDVGDGPVSEDALGRTQRNSPNLRATTRQRIESDPALQPGPGRKLGPYGNLLRGLGGRRDTRGDRGASQRQGRHPHPRQAGQFFQPCQGALRGAQRSVRHCP